MRANRRGVVGLMHTTVPVRGFHGTSLVIGSALVGCSSDPQPLVHVEDAGLPDAEVMPEAGPPDAEPLDAGPPDVDSPDAMPALRKPEGASRVKGAASCFGRGVPSLDFPAISCDFAANTTT